MALNPIVFTEKVVRSFLRYQLTACPFPDEGLHGQMRRSSRSVCTNIGEAWRKRRYKAAFIAKLSDAEGEACESQVWIEFARRCSYMRDEVCDKLDAIYDQIMGQIVKMIDDADKWLIK